MSTLQPDKIHYDLTRPWNSLDPWQKEYIETDPDQDCFLLCGRQVGKTTAMSIKAVELCVKHFKKGEFVLINSITEKQAYHMLAKAHAYAQAKYPREILNRGPDKPTKHRLMFKDGPGILCYAAGETGEGLRGFTVKKLMSDEGARMSEEYYIATMPMMSVIKGSMDISSTPAGKNHKDGTTKFFYKCSLDPKFKKFYVSAEDCPRHTQEFLDSARERLSRLAYAQEYLAVFTDELRRLFDDDMIKKICVLKRIENILIDKSHNYYLGVDVAGLGEDECTYEILKKRRNGDLLHVENIMEKRNYTTDTSNKVLELNQIYKFKQIGIDDGGLGFGVFSELLADSRTKRKVKALNNASRVYARDDSGKENKELKKKLLKEEMYINLQVLMEKDRIKLLDDDEVTLSLSSIQHEDGKIFGSYSHITEGIIRAVWMAEKEETLSISKFYSKPW